jgi:hypothetical protein
MVLEDLGLLRKDYFLTPGYLKKLPPEDQELLIETGKNLTQRGYGLRRVIRAYWMIRALRRNLFKKGRK